MRLGFVEQVKQLCGRVKKIFLILICLLVVFAQPASAEVRKTIDRNAVVISSGYSKVISLSEKGDVGYAIRITLRRHMLLRGDIVSSLPSFSVSIRSFAFLTSSPSTEFDPDKHFKNLVVFSVKTPPNFETGKGDSFERFTLNGKPSGISSNHITYGPNKKIFATAEKIAIVMPVSDGTEIRIELPGEVVKDWNYISTADMGGVKKELLNR